MVKGQWTMGATCKFNKKGLKEAALSLWMKIIKDENDCKSIVDFVIKNKNEQ